MHKSLNASFAILFLLIVLVMVVFLLYLEIREYTLFQKSSNWESFKAKITTSRIITYIEKDSSGGCTTYYKNSIKYRYKFSGKTYLSHKIGFGIPTSNTSYKEVKKIADRYKENTIVTIFVNPKNPKEAVLERNFDKTDMIYSIFFILISLYALVVVVKGYLESRKSLRLNK